MSITTRWELNITALSPISHRAETVGTTALLRRMKIIGADGQVELIPVISGNSLRGVLRRIGEELLRDVLGYDGMLPLAVAHALRNGGAITRTTAEPFTGARLRELRTLIPQLSVFGGAIGAAPIDGCLKVGHVIPVIDEARPLLRGDYPLPLPSRFDVEAIESYSHLDDTHPDTAAAAAVAADSATPASVLMRYDIETLAAGTRFESWIHLDRGSALDHAFLTDVLGEFGRRGWLGGRTGIGHGHIHTTLTETEHRTTGPDVDASRLDWQTHLRNHRDEALTLLAGLTR